MPSRSPSTGLRQRYREALRTRIASTVDDPSQIDDEIRDLFAALARMRKSASVCKLSAQMLLKGV